MTPDQIAQASEIIADSWRENKTIERLSGELRPQDQKTASPYRMSWRDSLGTRWLDGK